MSRRDIGREGGRVGGLWGAVCAVVGVWVWAGVPVWADAWDAPTGYYNTATGTGTTLKTNLYNIVRQGFGTNGFATRNYGDARFALQVTDEDPNNANNILLTYNRVSVVATWDSGVTWNREHCWPQYWLNISSISNTYTGPGSDLHALRPTTPSVNSSRSNNWYGYDDLRGTGAVTGFGNVTNAGTQYWYPGDADRGDVARSIFYMATRYGEGQTNNLSVLDGPPPAGGSPRYRMGDLSTLLTFHYRDPVDDFERRRNHMVYSSALNPTYYQGNRNPYVDRPELVWAVYGPEANNSRLSVATPAADGSSATTVNVGNFIKGSTVPTQAVTLNKSGTTPTTFEVTTTGSATASTSTGLLRQVFDYNAQSRSVTVGLATSATAGVVSGTVVVNNTDLTTAAAGQGSADGNDVITVTGTAVDSSNASFSAVSDVNTLTIDFGTTRAFGTPVTRSFSITNLLTASGFTARLDLDSFSAVGDSGVLSANLSTFTNINAASSVNFVASFNTAVAGLYSTTYTLNLSDENIPGAVGGQVLTLNLVGRATGLVPEPAALGLLVPAGLLLGRRARRG